MSAPRNSSVLERIGSAAAVGAAIGTCLTTIDFVAHQLHREAGIFEVARLRLLGSVPRFTFGTYFLLFSGKRYLWVVAVLLLWVMSPRARPVLRKVALWGACAVALWVGAMACATAYAFDRVGVGAGWVAIAATFLLKYWRRWRLEYAFILAAGLALGTLLAQGFYSLPFQDHYPSLVSPLWGFGPPVLAALVLIVILAVLRPRGLRPTGGSLPLWGALAVCISCIFAVGAEMRGIQARPAEPDGSRIRDEWAYDVYITGDPPQLVWTDRQKVHVLTNPYEGKGGDHYTVDDDEAYYVERIWPSPTEGFYIQGITKLEWWRPPTGAARLSYRPAKRYRLPPWLTEHSSTTWTVVEDPETDRLFTIGEYYSHFAVLRRSDGALVGQGILSNALWPFWHFTAAPSERALYASSALDDGGLYRMKLDGLGVERVASDLYLYETILDTGRNLLWGVRPLTGEVVAVDLRSYQMVHRIPVQFGLRDLQRDPGSGDLYVCSEIYGDVFRIAAQTLEPKRLGWCGRLCRSMYLDAERDALWVATRDGICRLTTKGTEP